VPLQPFLQQDRCKNGIFRKNLIDLFNQMIPGRENVAGFLEHGLRYILVFTCFSYFVNLFDFIL